MLAAGVTATITAAPAATIITAPHRDTPNCIIRVSLVSYLSVCECGGMVDALSSGGSECMLVGVQLPPLAQAEKGWNPTIPALLLCSKSDSDNILDNI